MLPENMAHKQCDALTGSIDEYDTQAMIAAHVMPCLDSLPKNTHMHQPPLAHALALARALAQDREVLVRVAHLLFVLAAADVLFGCAG
jgi:hypothetical protein